MSNVFPSEYGSIRVLSRGRNLSDCGFLLFPSSPLRPLLRCVASLQVMHSSKVYTRLAERLGLEDHSAILSVMLSKVSRIDAH